MSSIYFDLFHAVKSFVGLNNATLTAGSVVGEIVDAKGYRAGKLSYVLNAVGTSGTLILAKIEESDNADMSSPSDIPAERLLGTAVSCETAKAISQVGFIPVKRYVRPTFTAGGTNAVGGAMIELGGAEYTPVQE